jgi:hypothetical protein
MEALNADLGEPYSTVFDGAETVSDFLLTVIVPVAVAVSHLALSVGVKSNRTVAVPTPVIVAVRLERVITEEFKLVIENEPATDAVTVSTVKVVSP